MYDWANSAFATTVMSGFFPVFFKQFWSAGTAVADSTARLGLANSLASVVVALLAPILGSIADRGGTRKRFLLFFTLLGAVTSAGLALVRQGGWEGAAFLYVLAGIGFAGGVMFNDALIVDVSDERSVDFVSALGYSLGYLGGGILFAVNVWMTLSPGTFGLADAAQAVRVSFVSVGLWWAVFSIPLFLWVREKPAAEEGAGWRRAVTGGFRQLAGTLRDASRYRQLFLFLGGYWLYIDGVDTIIRMAVDYGLSIGLDAGALVKALLITQFVGFPSALIFGRVGERIGAKRAVLLGLAVYLGVTGWGYFMDTAAEFYALAVIIGLVQGGVQSLSRSFYSRLVPPGKSAEFFGLYNVMGKFATIFGPALMAAVVGLTRNPRLSILSVGILFVAGGALFSLVDEEEGRRAAREEGNA